jgi:hypothetical protein
VEVAGSGFQPEGPEPELSADMSDGFESPSAGLAT